MKWGSQDGNTMNEIDYACKRCMKEMAIFTARYKYYRRSDNRSGHCWLRKWVRLIELRKKQWAALYWVERLNRIQHVIEYTLREIHAGTENIFSFRITIDETLKINILLRVNFVDFKIAFDSPNRESHWKIVGSYGVMETHINGF